ncbi:MAG: hypothetical protein DMG32_16235 [Acidobacteria bacterium]|nr:MAG: hypothetical protein DMG32_16235 [Acidobacteriota bacterium]
MVPDIDGQLHHFTNVGLYNGLFVMQDAETKTLWNHITGEAMYGPLVGHNLGPIGNLLQMNVKQALAMDSKMQIAISDRLYFAGGHQFGSAGSGTGRRDRNGNQPDPKAEMSPNFVRTLDKEDQRRPRMELGLGVWTTTTQRYYPMEHIRERGRAFVDQLDGRKVLIYIDPETNTPAALFISASSAKIQDNEIHLDDGAVVRDGVLLDSGGKRAKAERPQQVFTRWYGFALTFPGCDIFGA